MTPDRWVDLLLNVITEALGILITVFLVDRIIKKREEARWKPSRYTVYAELLKLTSRMLHVLTPFTPFRLSDYLMYQFDTFYTRAHTDINRADLFSEHLINEISLHQMEVNIAELLKKRDDLLLYQEELSTLINKSGFFLEPELLSLILNLDVSVDRITNSISRHINNNPYSYLVSADADENLRNILELLQSVQNIQKHLAGICTRRITVDEYLSNLSEL